MQKKLTHVISSALLLTLGASVLGVSLHGAHARNLSTSDDWTIQSSNPMELLIDVQMPGSVPYLAFRVQDRAEDVTLNESDKPEVFLGRARQRAQSAAYAFRHGQPEMAFSTLLKSFVYLHKAVHACSPSVTEDPSCKNLQPLFESVADEIAKTSHELSLHTENDDLRAQIDGVHNQLEVVREQFSF